MALMENAYPHSSLPAKLEGVVSANGGLNVNSIIQFV